VLQLRTSRSSSTQLPKEKEQLERPTRHKDPNGRSGLVINQGRGEPETENLNETSQDRRQLTQVMEGGFFLGKTSRTDDRRIRASRAIHAFTDVREATTDMTSSSSHLTTLRRTDGRTACDLRLRHRAAWVSACPIWLISRDICEPETIGESTRTKENTQDVYAGTQGSTPPVCVMGRA